MFPVIDVGTFLKTFQAKVFPDWKKNVILKKSLGAGQNLWYSVIMLLCHKVAYDRGQVI